MVAMVLPMIDVINKAVVMAPSMLLNAGQKTQWRREREREKEKWEEIGTLKALMYLTTVIYLFTALRQTALIRLLFYTHHLLKQHSDVVVLTVKPSDSIVTVDWVESSQANLANQFIHWIFT